MAFDKLALYNGALQLLGERRLTALTDTVSTRYELDAIFELDPAYYCAEIIKPRFATKTVELSSPAVSPEHALDNVHTLPATFITMVGLFSDGTLDQRIQRFIHEGQTVACEFSTVYLRYVDSSLLDTLTNWSQTFRRAVIAYMATELAERIASDKKETMEALFNARVEASTTSDANEEPVSRPPTAGTTVGTNRLALYNNALTLLGLDRLQSTDQATEARYTLDDIWYLNAVRFCAEIVKPKFATKTVTLSGPTASTTHALSNTFTLPADYVDTVAVYADAELDQPINRFIQEGQTLSCDYSVVYLRYLSSTSLDNMLIWSPNFSRLVALYLAKQFAERSPTDSTRDFAAEFDALAQQAAVTEGGKDPAIRANAPTTTLTSAWLNIYNDALLILGESKITSVNDDSERRAILDTAIDADLVATALEDIGWYWAITSDKLTADPSLEPEWGYRYAYRLPDDMHRFDGIWYDEYFRNPIKQYSQEQDILFCEVDQVYIQYVSSNYIHTPEDWKPTFRRYIASLLAYNVRPGFPGADRQHVKEEYDTRKREMYSLDAQQSPPMVLTQGTWSRSRLVQGRNRGRP